MESFWKKLEYLDQTLLLYINQDGSNAFFDSFLPWVRQANMWAPLYLFMIVFVIHNFKWKGAVWIVALLCAVALTDIVSSHLLKDGIGRLRPGNDPFMRPYIRNIIGYYPQSFSFTSSHAANHFCIAMFIWQTGKTFIGKWLKLFFVWAAIISYAQMYVAVHYPLDILGGTIVGLTIGYLLAGIFNKQFGLLPGEIPLPNHQ